MSKRRVALVPMILVLALAGCGGGDPTPTETADAAVEATATDDGGEETTAPAGDPIVISGVGKGYSSPFQLAVIAGMQDAAAELGAELNFSGPDTENEIDKQINQLQAAVNSNTDALLFAALDSQAAIPLLETAQEKGIPVVAYDSGVESDIPVTTVSTDNIAAAEEAARQCTEALGGSGKVAVLGHQQTSVTGQQRRDGFIDYIEANAPGVEIVELQYYEQDQNRAQQLAASILQGNPDLDAFYATSDFGTLGAANEVEAAGRDVMVFGFDSSEGQIDKTRQGVITGAVAQNPYLMGYLAVQKAVAALNGEQLDDTYDSGFVWYNSENVDDPDVAAVLY